MEIKVSIAIQSHITDAMADMNHNFNLATLRLKFVKWLISRYPNTTERVDIDAEWASFIEFTNK
jgi:hypothetical protein